MKTIHLLLSTALAAFFLSVVPSPAQTSAPRVNLLDTEQRMLTSAKIGQRYELLVSLPDGYAKSGQSYPVLYVLSASHGPLAALLRFPLREDSLSEVVGEMRRPAKQNGETVAVRLPNEIIVRHRRMFLQPFRRR